MKKNLMCVIAVLFSVVSAFAETPRECYEKHPDAIVLFFKTPAAINDLGYPFDIERIALETPYLYIKVTQTEDEIVKYCVDTVDGLVDDGIVVRFSDGALMLLNEDCSLVYTTKAGSVAFRPDADKIDEFKRLQGE